jgi:hypothetical protein
MLNPAVSFIPPASLTVKQRAEEIWLFRHTVAEKPQSG